MSDRILYRILYGKIRCKLPEKTYLIYPVTILDRLRAEEIYEETLESALLKGCYSREHPTYLNLLFLEGLNPNFKQLLSANNKSIENSKIDLYQAFVDMKDYSEPKKNITRLIAENTNILMARYALDHLTAEGIADFQKNRHLIRSGLKSKVDDTTLSRIASWLAKNRLEEADYRKAARSNTWSLISNAQHSYTFSLFQNPLNDEQLNFLYWSKFYTNIYQHPEKPFDTVVEEDWALDGWCLIQKRKHSKVESENYVNSKITSAGVANSDQILIMAENQEMAQKIYDANDQNARNMIKARKVLIDKGKLDVSKETQISKGFGITN